jgi:endonuclease YncB( thermonuclease family)
MPATMSCKALLICAAAILASGSAAADWLVYLGGGLQETDGAWRERDGAVLFNAPSGMLLSVPAEDVDLPASAVISWQASGRRRPPARAPLPPEGDDATPSTDGCLPVRLLGLRGAETLEVAQGAGAETVHVACLDAPEISHELPELGFFGRAALSAIELELRVGEAVCLQEHAPPLRDGEGHRVLYVSLADGRDYAAEVIAGGLGMVRSGPCSRASYYRGLEERALSEERGLWGRVTAEAAFTALSSTLAKAAGPPPRRPRARGG